MSSSGHRRTENMEDGKEELSEPMSSLKRKWKAENQESKLKISSGKLDDDATDSC